MLEWVLLGLGAGIILIGVLVLMCKKSKGKARETDYRALFTIGIVFAGAGVPLAISTRNPGMLGITALGVIYMIMGLQHRDEWKKR